VIRGKGLRPRAIHLLLRAHALRLGLASATLVSVTVEACKLTTAGVVLESCVN
jgi:hypothetical protein